MGHLAFYGNTPDSLRMKVKPAVASPQGETGPCGTGKTGDNPPKRRRVVMKNKLFFGMIVCMALAIGLTTVGCASMKTQQYGEVSDDAIALNLTVDSGTGNIVQQTIPTFK
jgi:hypothetical protein